jgi:hypothetical protein
VLGLILNEGKHSAMDFYLQRLQDAIATATEDLDAETLLRHPPGKWCAAEILEHLYLTYTGTIKGFERCLEAGKPIARATTPMDRVRTLLVVGFNYLPDGRKAPKNTEPRGLPTERILAEVAAKISAMDLIIARAQEKYGAHARLLDHPILGPLRGPEWCKFHWVHGNHHLKQIRRLITAF